MEVQADPRSLDASQTEGGPRARWRGQVPRDLALIVVGALLAFASEEVRDARHRRARIDAAVASIRDELTANQTLVARAREHHSFLVDTLGKLLARHRQPDVSIYSNGMFNPAMVTSIAWQAARETGVLGDMPLATVLSIAPVYEAQERYRTMTEAMSAGIMSDVRRDGMETVLRDRFAQFVPLDVDFANRESALLDRYSKALAQLR
jgi:hypothetical protein